ncbi:hypothetical protein JOB18_047992 [Solea senegalensis]|uniref:Uncharacterized protein n=1 Tax=Solea senegalensis TaxID=28829 RepID=A0AAV6TBT6_SOLSE|nr:hypothetical protein JOB18_047992 [Solea senegalensis]
MVNGAEEPDRMAARKRLWHVMSTEATAHDVYEINSCHGSEFDGQAVSPDTSCVVFFCVTAPEMFSLKEKQLCGKNSQQQHTGRCLQFEIATFCSSACKSQQLLFLLLEFYEVYIILKAPQGTETQSGQIQILISVIDTGQDYHNIHFMTYTL